MNLSLSYSKSNKYYMDINPINETLISVFSQLILMVILMAMLVIAVVVFQTSTHHRSPLGQWFWQGGYED